MGNCIKCGQPAKYDYHVLEVQTLHVRDLTGERRVQALGRFQDYGVCASCARAYRNKSMNFWQSAMPKITAFGVILLAGVLTLLFFFQEGALRLFGMAGAVCGLAGCADTVTKFRKQVRLWRQESAKDGEAHAAWEVLLAHAPKKSEDSDLTYIPVTKKTLAMKKGDLMVIYDLLPQIAVKAWDLMHGKNPADDKPEAVKERDESTAENGQ